MKIRVLAWAGCAKHRRNGVTLTFSHYYVVIQVTCELTDFEKAIFGWIAERTDDFNLQKQLETVAVHSREFTGVGFYSKLTVSEQADLTKAEYGERGPLAGPNFEGLGTAAGGGCLLWFKQGFVDQLEVHSYSDEFPEHTRELIGFRFVGDDV